MPSKHLDSPPNLIHCFSFITSKYMSPCLVYKCLLRTLREVEEEEGGETGCVTGEERAATDKEAELEGWEQKQKGDAGRGGRWRKMRSGALGKGRRMERRRHGEGGRRRHKEEERQTARQRAN